MDLENEEIERPFYDKESIAALRGEIIALARILLPQVDQSSPEAVALKAALKTYDIAHTYVVVVRRQPGMNYPA
jgi:hypothetical protein